jgi:2-oxoglutarate ferredoxin oxidoreductase subunit gamma
VSRRFEARFAAVGGQGVILAGDVLAEAAANFEGLYAVQSPTYTAQVRGGTTKTDVIIDTEEILFPRATAIDFFLCLAQKSYERFAYNLKPQCIVLIDPNLVHKVEEEKYKIVRIPIIELTKKELGRMVFTSQVALGAMVELTHCVQPESMIGAIKKKVPQGTEEINIRAFNIGVNSVRRLAG